VAWDTRDNWLKITGNVSRSVFDDMSCGWRREVQTRADALLDALEERTNGTQRQESAATGTPLSDSMCWLRDVHEVAVQESTTQAPTASVTPSITYLEAFTREQPPVFALYATPASIGKTHRDQLQSQVCPVDQAQKEGMYQRGRFVKFKTSDRMCQGEKGQVPSCQARPPTRCYLQSHDCSFLESQNQN
jgi:hypothetical protein